MRPTGVRRDASLALFGAVLVLGAAWAKPLHAAPPAIRLRVDDVPTECIGEDELRQRLTALPQASDATQTIDVGVQLRADEPKGHLADVVVQSGGRGTQLRSVATKSSNCRDLDDALLVVIDALVTEATVDQPVKDEPRLPSPQAPAKSDRKGVSPPVPASAGGHRRHSVSLGIALEAGALPKANASARLDTRLSLGTRAGVRLGFGITPWTSSSTLETASVDFRLTSGRVLGCWDFLPPGRVILDACAGLDAGAISARADGLSAGPIPVRPAAWAVTGASLGFSGGWLVPEISGFFGPALLRDRYRATDSSGVAHTVHRPRALRFGVGVALGAALP